MNGADDGGELVRRLAAEVASQQSLSDEKVLLESIGPALDVLDQLPEADRTAVRGIVTTLTEGMEFDQRVGAGEPIAQSPGQSTAEPDGSVPRLAHTQIQCGSGLARESI